MPGTLTVNLTDTVVNVNMTFIGGSGTPTNPYEWRISNSDPLFAQHTLHTYRRSVGKDVDQLVLKFTSPYAITDSTTTQVSSPARAESTLTLNLPRTVPQSTITALVQLTASVVRHNGVALNLSTALEARQPG